MADGLRQADALQIHPVADGYVVRHPATGALHHLNKTAALLFELCDGQSSSTEVVAAVQKIFGLPPGQVRSVRAALDTLIRHGLIVVAVSPPVSPKAPVHAKRARHRGR